MKLKLAAAALAVLVAALPAAAQDAAAQRDRADAVRYLEATRHAFLKSLDGVTEAQWKFKASPETWSRSFSFIGARPLDLLRGA